MGGWRRREACGRGWAAMRARPENSKPSWLKNRLDKEKARAGSKSSVPHQPRWSSTNVKSVWRKVQPQEMNGPHTKPKLNRSHHISARTLMDFRTGKTVKIIYLSGVLSFYLLSEMASSLIVKALQVNFDSVLGIPDNDGMVKMFRVLESTGLRGFLGYPWFVDAVTHERFVLMTTIHFELKVNWSKLMFDILKEMADKSSKRAKGYADQIRVLLKGDPAVTLKEAKTFPTLKILSTKTVGTYVTTNKTIDARDESDEPEVAKIIYLSDVLSFYLLSEMASSLIANALQVNFDSVLVFLWLITTLGTHPVATVVADSVEMCIEFLDFIFGWSHLLLSSIPCIASAFYSCCLLLIYSCYPYWGLTPCPSRAWFFCCLLCCPGHTAGRGGNPDGGAPGGG
ncbi:auxin efflux carrier component 5 [Dorcoceras hygrometricum]|uniref:Auxin efflux carrier component 5 n=1 Tax=Dorcoceras hygrometricum TaxID=472368 RepID=A0A2Z7BD86_9LAMI|nr:auxin efflux carrier component 5 [Dorcoceras hygrometricum]